MVCNKHREHQSNVYGQTTYGIQSCKECFIQAYKLRTSSRDNWKFSSSETAEEDTNSASKINFSKSISNPNNPLIDTVSNFPSPAGEAIFETSQAHLPMFNRENEIRPSEVQRFLKKIDVEDEEFVRNCKSPWEQVETDEEPFIPNDQEEITKDEKPSYETSLAKKTLENTEYAQNLLKDSNKLREISTKEFYKTSTQRMYAGVDWKNSLHPSLPPPSLINRDSHNTKELHHQIQRYHQQTTPFKYASASWDSIQSRLGYHHKKPFEFCSISKKSKQVPNYQGTICGIGEKDVLQEKFTPLTLVRTSQPKYTHVSSRSKTFNSGYNGVTSSITDEKLPVLSQSRHQRFATHPATNWCHQSPFSKTVSLVHPFVPYNKVDYKMDRTASGNRVY